MTINRGRNSGPEGSGRLNTYDMKIKVTLIGPLVHEAGFSEKEIEVPAATTAEVFLGRIPISRTQPKIVTRNGKVAAPGDVLEDGDNITVSPFYSGG
jgi:sulfur carrier protein ThiS